jgi:hypothetical protein
MLGVVAAEAERGEVSETRETTAVNNIAITLRAALQEWAMLGKENMAGFRRGWRGFFERSERSFESKYLLPYCNVCIRQIRNIMAIFITNLWQFMY